MHITVGSRGIVVVQALCYKLECRKFDSPGGHWNFAIDLTFAAALRC
jgi:hypothetical protein